MSYLEELRKSRFEAQVAYQEFVLHTRQGKDGLFCFFEGKDNAYYVPIVKRFTKVFYSIKCGGRDKVLDVYRLITAHVEYNKYKKAFFIDRDFNYPLPSYDPPIFETPCYSIENLYVSENVFKQILINEFHLSEVSDNIYKICLSLYIERQKEFHLATTLLNSWYASLIEIKNSTGEEIGVNLDEKLPKDFINFSLESISANYDLEKIKKVFPKALDISEEALAMKINEFSNCDQHLIFRGKYEMQFLIKIIQMLLKDSLTSRKYVKEKISFGFGDASGLNNEQAISIFSGYADIPNSLLDYLIQVS